MKVNKKFLNPELYTEVANEIKKKYPKHSIYRSMMIVKEYKKRGGEISDDNEKGINKWLDEKWINMDDYLDGIITKCGDSSKIKESSCRPLIRVDNKTPILADEVIKKHGRSKIRRLINIKNQDPQNLILQWKEGKIIKKKSK